jgi:haloalkane dehalogenase
MPGLVPIRPDDPASDANRAAWSALTANGSPALIAFSDGDPITADMGPILKRMLPGARGREHPTIAGAGHFLQEDAGPELAAEVVAFVQATPVG